MPSFSPLAAESSLPLYEQMMQHVRTAILSSQYVNGDRLPTESELCRQYGVSRITVRRAIAELVQEGLLERKQGKGTFVSYQKLDLHVMSLGGFAGFTKGRDSRVRILDRAERPATAKEAQLLGIAPGAGVYVLTRMLEDDGVPIMLDRSIYYAKRFPGLLDGFEETSSTYDRMSRVYGHSNWRAVKEIELTPARPEEAECLRCNTGEMLYLITKVIYDRESVANHCSFNLICSSRVKLTLNYTRAQTEA